MGTCLEPESTGTNAQECSWDELQTFVNGNVLHKEGVLILGRPAEFDAEYTKEKREVKAIYVEYIDFIKSKYLAYDLEEIQCDDGVKLRAIAPVTDRYEYHSLRPNMYPYSLEPSVKHFVLWSTKRLNPGQIENCIKKEYPNQEYLWWENPLNLKSIPEVFHIHVLIRLLNVRAMLFLRNYIRRLQIPMNPQVPESVLTWILTYNPVGAAVQDDH